MIGYQWINIIIKDLFGLQNEILANSVRKGLRLHEHAF